MPPNSLARREPGDQPFLKGKCFMIASDTTSVRFFTLGDYEVWAGASLQECIHAAMMMYFLEDTPELREQSGYVGNSFEISDRPIRDEENGNRETTLSAIVQEMQSSGHTLPFLVCSTD